MFFALSKILQFLIVPIYWLLALLVAALIFKNKRKPLLISAIALLYLYTTEMLVVPILGQWEIPMVWLKDVDSDYEAAIVLGGMSSPGKKPDDRVHFPGSPDRLLHAMQLYKMGKVKKIIITGGSGELLGKRIPEAEYLERVLLLCSVDPKDIIIEDKSKNTRENATFTAEIIKKQFKPGSKYLLVTSGWHMRRSLGCFEKVGLNVTPFSCDSQLSEVPTGLFRFFPNPWAAGRWQVLFHEVMGYISYKAKGYI